MPRQNRVTPFGTMIATSERGLFMGNRGILHNERKEIVTPYRSKAWIICRLQFKGRTRTLMSPGSYTELFFLDEATALAAGHRPCFECQRDRALAFREAWQQAHETPGNRPLKMSNMDSVLHQERLTPGRIKNVRVQQTYTAVSNTLPDGAFISVGKRPFLIWHRQLYPWTPGGYEKPVPFFTHEPVTVLTPPAIVRVLAHGYGPIVHESADGPIYRSP